MIDVNDIHVTILDLLNKNNSQYISPSEIDRFVNLASMDYFNELLGSKTQKKTVYGRDRILDRRLNSFRVSIDLNLNNGTVNKPNDLEAILSLSHSTTGIPQPIRQLDEMRVDKIFDNPLAKPILEDASFLEQRDSIIVYPTMAKVTLRYLKTPNKCLWSYNLVSGRPVFDPTSSISLEWDESEKPQIIMRAANYLGLDIRDIPVVQFTDKEKTQQA